jgi:3-hydroxyisobutyrate dehydrogenase-like beta-hydroxyacid dehydrogenase
MKVGWIGLGQIGEPMALRVLGAGHELVGHSRRADGREALVQAGARLTGSVIEAVAGAEVVGVCLFDDKQVKEALVDGGALAALEPGAVMVLHTTGDPRVVEDLAARAPAGAMVLDATFSGAAAMAARGALTLLIGGEAAALEKARPVLSAYSDGLFHLGQIGAGRRLKLLNNLLFAAQVSLSVEALAAAERSGLDPDVAIKAMNRCSGASYALNKFAVPQSVDTVLAGLKPYLDKDVEAARKAAADEGLDLSLLSGAARWGSGRPA